MDPAQDFETAGGVEWRHSDGLVPYEEALAFMEARAAAIAAGAAPECIWLLEHPPLYTAGTGARDSDLLTPDRFPVHRTGRGGQYTYHGPGQRVVYTMLDIRRRGADLRRFVADLEAWIVAALARLDVAAFVREGRVGVWVERPDGGEDKIAAIGIRVRRWVSFHGIAVNVAPDLGHYSGIVPCGIRGHGVTSLAALGKAADMAALDRALHETFEEPGLGATTPLEASGQRASGGL